MMTSWQRHPLLLLGTLCFLSNTCHALQYTPVKPTSKTISGVPYSRGGVSVEGGARRVEYVAITVDDLDKAGNFYGDVLGGVEVQLCSNGVHCNAEGYVVYSGDVHMSAMFGCDMESELNRDERTIPDISASGNVEVHSRFFSLKNAIVQLVKYSNKNDGSVYDLREPMTSPVWMAKAHMCLWIEDGIDMNDYILDVETRSHRLGMPDVAFNRPVPQQTREDRANVPLTKYANKVNDGSSFDGLSWSYFKGPVGEQLELYQIEKTMKLGVGRAYCDRGAVSSAFVENQFGRPQYAESTLETNSTFQSKFADVGRSRRKPLSSRLHGAFQYGFRTGNLHMAAGFYSEVLGGDLVTYPTQGIEIMRDDSAHWMIQANETIEAYEYAVENRVDREVALRTMGVANISSTGEMRLDHRFILFDNFVVEPLQYTDGLTFGGEVWKPTLPHSSSPAYVGTVVGAFGMNAAAGSIDQYLEGINTRANRGGFRHIVLPKMTASFDSTHPLNGLEYGYAKGPDGEAIALVRVESDSPFANALHKAVMATGGVSTLFGDTDAFASGGMDDFCASVQNLPPYDSFARGV